jgi:hypothetical protein
MSVFFGAKSILWYFTHISSLFFHSSVFQIKRAFKSQEDFCFKDKKIPGNRKIFETDFKILFLRISNFFEVRIQTTFCVIFLLRKTKPTTKYVVLEFFSKFVFFCFSFGIKERKNTLGIFFAFLLFDCFFRFHSSCFFVRLHQHMFWNKTKPSCFKKRRSFFEKHEGPCQIRTNLHKNKKNRFFHSTRQSSLCKYSSELG